MTLQEFTTANLNKKMERVDASNLNQCFDLAVGYCMDVLGTDNRIFEGLELAYQIFENPTEKTGSEFDFIKNNFWAVPRAGDIIVFSSKYGPAGHVAVVVSADVNSFQAFSQNDPTGSPCVMKTYDYTYVLGWIRKITNSVDGSEVAELKKKIDDLQATEIRIKQEKDQALADTRVYYERLLAEQRVKCRQEIKDEIIKKIQSM